MVPLQALLHFDEFLAFALEHARHRDPCPQGNDTGDVFVGHFLMEQTSWPSGFFAQGFLGVGRASVEVVPNAYKLEPRGRSIQTPGAGLVQDRFWPASSWLLMMLTALMAAFRSAIGLSAGRFLLSSWARSFWSFLTKPAREVWSFSFLQRVLFDFELHDLAL